MIIDEKFQVGQVVKGKVVQIKEYGAFVELEPGLDGLVHISEVAHSRVSNLANELSIGQEVFAKILEINKEKKRISLSIKETLEPPAFTDSEDEEAVFEEVLVEEVEAMPKDVVVEETEVVFEDAAVEEVEAAEAEEEE